MIPIDAQIEALCEAHDREMARLHLGCSPYDDEDEPIFPDTWGVRLLKDQAYAPA